MIISPVSRWKICQNRPSPIRILPDCGALYTAIVNGYGQDYPHDLIANGTLQANTDYMCGVGRVCVITAEVYGLIAGDYYYVESFGGPYQYDSGSSDVSHRCVNIAWGNHASYIRGGTYHDTYIIYFEQTDTIDDSAWQYGKNHNRVYFQAEDVGTWANAVSIQQEAFGRYHDYTIVYLRTGSIDWALYHVPCT